MKANNFYKYVSITGFSLGALFMYIIIKPKEVKQPQIKPCKCISVQELRYYIAKHEIYMDSLNYGAKKNRSRYADSTIKFGEILRKND